MRACLYARDVDTTSTLIAENGSLEMERETNGYGSASDRPHGVVYDE